MLEFYWAYADVNQMMDFCEQMIRAVVLNTTGTLQIKFKGDFRGVVFLLREKLVKEMTIDFERFDRFTMKEAIVQHVASIVSDVAGEDLEGLLNDSAKAKALLDFLWWRDNEYISLIEKEDATGEIIWSASEEERRQLRQTEWNRLTEMNQSHVFTEVQTAANLIALFEDFVEANLEQPTFITAFPKAVSPLSKADPSNRQLPSVLNYLSPEWNVANGFSELNDPKEQFDRFNDQMLQRERGDDEAMVMDEDYIRALSYGMPPAAGIGIGVDRFVMLLTNRTSIRDVILFPHMRPERKPGELQPDEQAEITNNGP